MVYAHDGEKDVAKKDEEANHLYISVEKPLGEVVRADEGKVVASQSKALDPVKLDECVWLRYHHSTLTPHGSFLLR
jgi:hypothetical protein